MYKSGTKGEQRTLVLVINGIADLSKTWDSFFGGLHSVDHFYRAASYGKLWFTGEVVPVRMEIPSTCDPPLIATRASEAAAAQGIDLELYDRRAYIGAFNCPWYGLGALGQGMTTPGGRSYGQIWLVGLGNQTHEIGHSLGMAHANSDKEYGDPSDQMGIGPGREMNGPHRLQMGWLEPGQTLTVLESGIYRLTPLEVYGGVKLLQIRKSDTEQYYLSYRQPLGDYDGTFYPGLTSGASIHRWSPQNVPYGEITTKFVDTSPWSDWSYLDAPLVDGMRYSDSAAGVTFEQLSHTGGADGEVLIKVIFGAAPPPPPPPPPTDPVKVTPATATIRPKGVIQFVSNVPVNWSISPTYGSISSLGLYMAPGANKSALVTVTATSKTDPANRGTASISVVRR